MTGQTCLVPSGRPECSTVADLENLQGVQGSQLNRRGFTTPINYNARLLTIIRALFLADVESDYSHVHFVVR